MKIGLIDADLMWQKRANGRRYGKTKADIFPNLAIMKLSAWHKQQGDEVEWYFGLKHYDRVYVSKVFSTTPESTDMINADEVIRGGSGYAIQLIDGREVWNGNDRPLPPEVEHMMPDYSLYPMVKDTAIGFLSRGCPRGCHFCHVAAKEGRRSYKMADLSEWWSGQRNICLCDPNILACREWRDLLGQLADSKARVDINQGMDARLLTVEKVEMLNRRQSPIQDQEIEEYLGRLDAIADSVVVGRTKEDGTLSLTAIVYPQLDQFGKNEGIHIMLSKRVYI